MSAARAEQSGLSTTWRRPRRYAPRLRAWVELARGEGVTDDGRRFRVRRRGSLSPLLAALPPDVARVYVVGPRPGKGLEGFHRWRAGVPAGWEPGEHYLRDLDRPVLRYRRTDSAGTACEGQAVEIHRAASWFGEGEHYDPDDARHAMSLLTTVLERKFGDGAMVMTTPGTTGRELFRLTIPYGVEWPVLTNEHQELIRSTSGQGRIEPTAATSWRAHHDRYGVPDPIPGFCEVDGRFMYAALCRELPSGPAVHDDEPTFEPYARGRYRVRFTVPHFWRQVGLLPVRDAGGGWCYPGRPGETAVSWCDGAELLLAQKCGWSFHVLERLLFTGRRGPLDTWARKLIEARDGVDELARHLPVDNPAPAMVRVALRNIVLFAIGAFYGRPYPVTRTTPMSDPLPDHALEPIDAGDHWTWTEMRPSPVPELAHPEWSAAIWARCRARMLSGPDGTGALHVPADELLAVSTDALYLTRDPEWSDDGRVGRLRVKSNQTGPFPRPKTRAALLRLRKADQP